MTEKPANCQWCGAEVWPKYSQRGRRMFKCFTIHTDDGGWFLGETCEGRCVEQLRKLRTLTADDVTPEQVEAVEQAVGWRGCAWEGQDFSDVIAAAVKVMIGGFH